jgi:type IV fimbrial biogenesis protein FimT
MIVLRQMSTRHCPRSRIRSAERGLTLIELMISVAVLAILLGIAVPSFTNATLGSRLSSHASKLVAGAALARSEAIKRNAVVAMCASADGATCASSGGWQQGWIVIHPGSGSVLLSEAAAPDGFRITAASNFTRVNFQPTGVGVTYLPTTPATATLTVCRSSPSIGNQERVVTLAPTGRASVSRTTSGACP